MSPIAQAVSALALACAFASPALAAPASADAGPSANIRAVVAQARRLPPGAIDELKTVELGGSKQWISVRGAHAENPIILFLHGGPGWPMMPISWTYQRPWEDYFTVVQWDQRGGGKSVAAGGKPGEPPQVTVERMQSDAEDLVRYLLKTYGKRKIILVGHSWGSYLGVRLVKAHPEWFYAYVGIGQVVNLRRNEQESYALTLRAAQAHGDKAAVDALKALAPYPGAEGPIDVRKTGAERQWVVKFRGMEYARDEEEDDPIVSASPDYTDEDARNFGPASGAVTMALWPELSDSSLDQVTRLGMPVFLFAGRHDMTTPPLVARAWFDRLSAPQKRFFWFEDSAHYVVTEEPGLALNRLVAYVRPLAMPKAGGKGGN